VTGGAFPEIDVSGKFHADRIGLGLQIAPVQLVQDTLEGLGIKITAAAPVGIETDLLFARSVQQGLLHGRRQLREGGVDVETVMPGQGIEHLVITQGVAARPGNDGPLPEGKATVGDNETLVKEHLAAQTVAFIAGPVRAVEGKHPRGQFRNADTAFGAGVFFAEE